MRKKDIILYSAILILILLFLWHWLSKASLINQLSEFQKDKRDLHLLSGIGELKSAHLHADVKVYINAQALDFSAGKYQLASRFIHFEEGVGDVIHAHATGLTVDHMFKSVGIKFNSNCIVVDGNSYCNDGSKKLKFYVNRQPNNEFGSYVIRDLDKILVSYGNEDEAAVQKQLDSITNLARKSSFGE